MFVDRDSALNNFKQIFSTESNAWMILSGCKNVGKTSFAKKITNDFKSARYCTKEIAEKYAVSFVKSILPSSNLINLVKQYAHVNNHALEIVEQIGCKYLGELTELQAPIAIEHFISDDLNSSAYRFLNFICQMLLAIEIIFLDDFHLCDYSSYIWITKFYQALSHKIFLISICDFETEWESEEVFKTFNRFNLLLDIENFDNADAFYDILQQHLMFENATTLRTLARNIYNHFGGKSKMLFDMLDLINVNQCLNDTDKYKQIMNALKIILYGEFDDITKAHWLVLDALAFCPCPLSKYNLIHICDINESILSDLILDLYNKRLISQTVDQSRETLYIINGEFLVKIIVENCSKRDEFLIKSKVLNEAIKNHINLSLEQKLTLSIDIDDPEALNYLMELLSPSSSEIDENKKVYFINKYLLAFPDKQNDFISIEIAHLLYDYGYYDTAKRTLNTLIAQTDLTTYGSLMLFGDIQHVLLDKNASATYEKASKVHGISDSMKLQAINRQIMALNQEHKEKLARTMYSDTLIKYSNAHCLGLVELYRNTNNSFGYRESLQYTIQGYCIAKQLGEELEMYKCLHNINCLFRKLFF